MLSSYKAVSFLLRFAGIDAQFRLWYNNYGEEHVHMKNGTLVELSFSYTGDSNYYLIEYDAGEYDTRILAKDGRLLCFRYETNARDMMEQMGLPCEYTRFLDAERLSYWLKTGSRSQIFTDGVFDSSFLLFFWNLYMSAANALGVRLSEPAGADECYQKLLCGCAPLTDGADLSRRHITEQELLMIRQILSAGERLLSENMTDGD